MCRDHGTTMLLSIVVFALTTVAAQKGEVFRTELFPEQFAQQRVQFRQSELQLRMADIQRLLQVSSGPRQLELLNEQVDIQKQMADLQLEQLRLQEEIQRQLGSPVQFKRPQPVEQPQFRPTAQRQFEPQPQQQPQFQQQPQQQFQQQQPRPQPQPQQQFQQQQPRPQPQPQQQFQQPQQQFQPQPPQQQFQPQPPQQRPQPQQQVRPRPQPDGNRLGSDEEEDIVLPCDTVAGEEGLCRPLIKCLAFYADLPELKRKPCPLGKDQLGVCCPRRTSQQSGTSSGVLRPPRPPPITVPQLSPQQLNEAAAAALEALRERFNFVNALFSQGIFVQPQTPAAWHLEFFPTTNETLERGDQAQKNVEASTALVNQFNLSPDQGTFGLPSFSILNTVIGDTCPRVSQCRISKYRTPDGSCNNLEHSHWGKAGTALQRILPPKYTDGVNAPRIRGSDGVDLPASRLVSTRYAQDADISSENYTVMVMQWGQFLDHDLTHTPISRGSGGSGITCCRRGEVIEARLRHPDCLPITLPNNDRVFSKFKEHCMEFARSLPAPRPECNFGPREQMNQITGYLDGSNVYGSNERSQRSLREFRGGRLKVQNVRGRQLLPANPTECTDDNDILACFEAGDGRVNEQVELALMHTVWMREHNRVAGALQSLHPDWTDEAVFQEARRIVVAEMQHITYNEFLPIILGEAYMSKFSLRPKEEGYTQDYDKQLNGGITNVFATSAFRFGHSLIQSHIHGYGKFGNLRHNLQLSKQHFSPFVLYKEGAFDDFIRGLSAQSARKNDRFFTSELTDHLFQGDLDIGLDLFSLNVQRGRDHGLPPYNDWREVCGLPRARTWADLEASMDSQTIQILSELYSNVNEVDLFVGAMGERSAEGALLGPTFVCLVGDQFARLRRGDRFYYEEANQPSSFSQEQLKQIKKASLARILCDNSDDIALMQPLAFIQPSFLNQRVGCNSQSIPRVDLSAWAPERPAQA